MKLFDTARDFVYLAAVFIVVALIATIAFLVSVIIMVTFGLEHLIM